MNEIIKFLNTRKNDAELVNKLNIIINQHLEQEKLNIVNSIIKEINDLFLRTSAYNELKAKCDSNQKLFIALQYYDNDNNKKFLYTIKIQNQSITRINENGKFTHYINDKLFIADNELFNLKLEHLKPSAKIMFDKFHERFCNESDSEIEQNNFYLSLIDIVITFGEFLGQL